MEIAKVYIGRSVEQKPQGNQPVVCFTEDGSIRMKHNGRWYDIGNPSIGFMSILRSDEDYPVNTANADNFVRFSVPFPLGTKYSLNAWVINAEGIMQGIKIGQKLNTGFYVNPMEPGKCGYQAMVKI